MYWAVKLTVALALTIRRFFSPPFYIEKKSADHFVVYLKGTDPIVKCCEQIFLMSEEQTIRMETSFFHSVNKWRWIDGKEKRSCSRSFKMPELIWRIPVANSFHMSFFFFRLFFSLLNLLKFDFMLCNLLCCFFEIYFREHIHVVTFFFVFFFTFQVLSLTLADFIFILYFDHIPFKAICCWFCGTFLRNFV